MARGHVRQLCVWWVVGVVGWEGRVGGEGVVGWVVESRRGEGGGLPEAELLVCLRVMVMFLSWRPCFDVVDNRAKPSMLPTSSAECRYRGFRETEIVNPTPTTPPQKLVLHVPLRETVGAMKVLIGAALRVASREAATTALRALCDDGDRSATPAPQLKQLPVTTRPFVLWESDGRLTVGRQRWRRTEALENMVM